MSPESRSRMVSFRLTIEEYERFRQLCIARGLNNVSEMVRAAVNHLLADPAAPADTLESRVSILERRVQSLTGAVERLNQSSDARTYRQTASSR